MARGAESIFRGSLFRAGYETLYTPIPAADKRAAKSIIDVAFDRMGDAVGGEHLRREPRCSSSGLRPTSVRAVFNEHSMRRGRGRVHGCDHELPLACDSPDPGLGMRRGTPGAQGERIPT